MTLDTLPDRGHNQPPELITLPSLPPEPTEEALEAAIASIAPTDEPLPYNAVELAKLAATVAAFTDACGKWKDLKTISTVEQSGKLTDFITGARGVWTKIETKRKEEKGVHDARAKIVQDAFTLLLDKVKKATDDLKPMQAAWLVAENARIAKEKADALAAAEEKRLEAERLAAAAASRNDVSGEVEAARMLEDAKKETKQAARTETAKSGSATGGGRAMSLRTVKTAEIHSRNAVYMHFRDHPDVVELLQRLATQAVQAGFEFEEKILTVKTVQVAA